MASKAKRAELLMRVQESIVASHKKGNDVVIHTGVEEIFSRYPDLINDLGKELSHVAVAQMFRGQLNSFSVLALAGVSQLSLFGVPDDILADLPPTITVPVDGEEAIHVVLSRATVGQVRAYEKMLAAQIKADQRKHRSVRYLTTKCISVSDETKLTDAFTAVPA